jgi:hypothetical protein
LQKFLVTAESSPSQSTTRKIEGILESVDDFGEPELSGNGWYFSVSALH